ncbi:MAG: hypothetical protein WBD56_12300 [Anaerolineales bacterium]
MVSSKITPMIATSGFGWVPAPYIEAINTDYILIIQTPLTPEGMTITLHQRKAT